MRYTLVVLVLLCLGCNQGRKYHNKNTVAVAASIAPILAFQEELNNTFKDPEVSPLPDRYRKNFESLDFFDADTSYVVWAKLKRTPEADPFLMPTTTDRQNLEVVYGIAQFKLKEINYSLEVYRSLDTTNTKIPKDYLFLPFLDNTNGTETYGGGRYIDLTIPEGDSIQIDFNKAYNPYCVYNKKYSCPIVPRTNSLDTRILAGVKMFDPKK